MSDRPAPSFLRRAARAVFNTTLTLAVVAAAAFAVIFGSDFLADRAAANATTSEADPLPVAAAPLTLVSGYEVQRTFVGQVEAASTVSLSFELGGRLSALLVDEGETVTAGQVLARLDTAVLEADRGRLTASREATQARLTLAETRLARAGSLKDEGFASQETLDQAIADRDELTSRINEIDASIAAVDINLRKSVLEAPFAGRVGQRNVDGGETLGAGAPVLTLINTSEPQVRVGLPLSLDTERLENAEISIDGATYPARLAQVRPDIDPTTRTRTAIFSVDSDRALTFGQTATLILRDRIEAAGTWVPLDALQEGLGGAWTVLTVEDNTVRTASVEILHIDGDRAYVRGTFEDGARMITTGAHRVVPGQQVRETSDAMARVE